MLFLPSPADRQRACHLGWSELTVCTTESDSVAPERAEDEVTLEASDEMYAGDDCAVTPKDLLPEHLEAALQHCYLKLQQGYVDLYNWRLGRIYLDDYIRPLRVDYTPSHAKPYSVLRSQEDAARREMQSLLELDVVEQIYGSEAAAPAFILVNPDGSLRRLVGFRQLNRYLRRSPYYVPKIREILLRLGKAKCMTTLDTNMGYFARRIARQSRAATAFCLPFGKCQFKRLPMGISTAPDEYQSYAPQGAGLDASQCGEIDAPQGAALGAAQGTGLGQGSDHATQQVSDALLVVQGREVLPSPAPLTGSPPHGSARIAPTSP
ncbi:unnamed protein product [Phytophthora fragariaefolia]|uniref:Unnamed protein product n=1 Tax=Phytophthora fragariaefolia TaxID=1490495 RepID=A0A9W6Y2H6_9STRA|nr:unnamed protein product [Phytophthora fragariaefolia]